MRDEFFSDDTLPILAGPVTMLRTVARKSQFQELANSLAGALLEENTALEAYVRIKNVAEVLEVALAQLKDQAIDRVNGSTEEILGATVQLKALPKKWEYDDAEVRRLEGEKAAVETNLKSRKRFLEHLTSEIVDAATSELIHPARCLSEGVTIQVSF